MSYQIRFTLLDGRTGRWMREYATREEAQQAIDDRMAETGPTYAVEEVVTREARFRELEAEVAHLRDAYDAARQDRDHALAKVARLKATAAMLESDLFTARESAKVAWARSQMASCKTVGFMVRLDRAIELGDAMHRANPSEEWAAYKEDLAATSRGPAKASEAPKDAP